MELKYKADLRTREQEDLNFEAEALKTYFEDCLLEGRRIRNIPFIRIADDGSLEKNTHNFAITRFAEGAIATLTLYKREDGNYKKVSLYFADSEKTPECAWNEETQQYEDFFCDENDAVKGLTKLIQDSKKYYELKQRFGGI